MTLFRLNRYSYYSPYDSTALGGNCNQSERKADALYRAENTITWLNRDGYCFEFTKWAKHGELTSK